MLTVSLIFRMILSQKAATPAFQAVRKLDALLQGRIFASILRIQRSEILPASIARAPQRKEFSVALAKASFLTACFAGASFFGIMRYNPRSLKEG
jgi:hypothetical protein